MTPSEILTAARELISAPERWTQEAFARDAGGNSCSEKLERAVCFCSWGAFHRAGYSIIAEHFLRSEMDGMPGRFNDTHTHAEVLAAFDRAIEAAKEAGQ
jgi:hypothetical protein